MSCRLDLVATKWPSVSSFASTSFEAASLPSMFKCLRLGSAARGERSLMGGIGYAQVFEVLYVFQDPQIRDVGAEQNKALQCAQFHEPRIVVDVAVAQV